jgi:hypothetical protein
MTPFMTPFDPLCLAGDLSARLVDQGSYFGEVNCLGSPDPDLVAATTAAKSVLVRVLCSRRAFFAFVKSLLCYRFGFVRCFRFARFRPQPRRRHHCRLVRSGTNVPCFL